MLPSRLHYQSKVEPAMAKSYRSNIQPQNGTGPYNQNDTIIFNLPTRNNLCFVPTESYLKFNATFTNTDTDVANYYRLDSNGAHGFIRRIRVFHGSNLLEDIDNYEVLAKMMFDLQAPYTATQGKLSITSGTRSDLALDKAARTKAFFTSGAATDTQLASAFNAIPSKVIIPNHGALLNPTTGTVAVNGTITTQTFCINLISIIGTLCNEKYFPLFACKSAALRLEIQLVPNLYNAVATDQAGKFTIKDVEYVMNTIELSDSAMGIIQSSLNGEPLQFCITDYRNYVWNGSIPNTSATSFSVPINAKFSSLKSILIASRDTGKTGTVTYFPCSSNTFSLSQYYFRIGAQVYPSKFPSTTSEYFAEVVKATGSLSDMHHAPAIDYESYNQTVPAVNNDLFYLAADYGVNTYKSSSIHSGSFYTGIDLENYATADRTNIFAGYNSNSDDIFYVPSFPSQTAIGNIRFDSFAMYDAVLVFQNDTVYCKF